MENGRGVKTMTEKRFKHKWNKLGMQFICYDDKAELLGTFADDIGVTNIVELLNKQDEKIKELKEENQQYKILTDELKRQNKKLKGRLNDLGVEYY